MFKETYRLVFEFRISDLQFYFLSNLRYLLELGEYPIEAVTTVTIVATATHEIYNCENNNL